MLNNSLVHGHASCLLLEHYFTYTCKHKIHFFVCSLKGKMKRSPFAMLNYLPELY